MVEATQDGFDLRKTEEGETTAPSFSTDARSTAGADDVQSVVSDGGKTKKGGQEARSENSHPHGPPVVQPAPEAIQEPEVVTTPTTSEVITQGKATQLSREQVGTKAGCKHNTAAMGCHSCIDKNQLPPVESSLELSTATKSELLEAPRSDRSEIESTYSKGEGAEGSDLPDVRKKEKLPIKRIKLETEVTGALTLTETQEWPLLQEKSVAPPPSLTKTLDDNSEADDVAMAATTRSMTSSRKPHLQQRPTKLLVGTPPSHDLSSDEEGAEEMFVSGEEERTPEGGRGEFVGHAYKSHLINNGEVVVPPEKFPTPPDMVTGYVYPLEPYRRQFSDNNQYQHTLSYRQGGAANAQAYRRYNSEPSGGAQGESYAYIDNNGRKVFTKNHDGRSTI